MRFSLRLGPLYRRQTRLCAREGGRRLVRRCADCLELGFHRFPLSLGGRKGVSALLGRVGLGTLEMFCASLRLLEFGLGTAQLGLQRPYRLLQFGTRLGRSLTLRACRLECAGALFRDLLGRLDGLGRASGSVLRFRGELGLDICRLVLARLRALKGSISLVSQARRGLLSGIQIRVQGLDLGLQAICL